jgi:hypothetical protein
MELVNNNVVVVWKYFSYNFDANNQWTNLARHVKSIYELTSMVIMQYFWVTSDEFNVDRIYIYTADSIK